MSQALGQRIDSAIARIEIGLQSCLTQHFYGSIIADPLGSKPAGEMILPPFPEDTGKDAVFRKAETLAFIQYDHYRTAALPPG